jgi:hypothetical protein
VFWNEPGGRDHVERGGGHRQPQCRRRGSTAAGVEVAERCSPVDERAATNRRIDEEAGGRRPDVDEVAASVVCWHF